MSELATLPDKVIATPSDLREQGREAFRVYDILAVNPYKRRDDTCAYENWLEGFLQAEYAAEWQRRHRP